MSNTTLPKEGDVLDGKYRVDRIIGEGGMGVVYEAFHLRLRQRVAIKVLRPTIVAHPEFVARFEREARAAATLESTNVAKVLDVDTTPDGLVYMVIELLEGNDLAEELTRRGRFPVQEAVAYVMEACVPIAEAHAMGIIHRDLKPSNLFLAKKGGERTLKLLDFGISKVLTETDAKSTSSLVTLGTPHYMSPEHVRNSSDVDRRSDIWSLGVILYELLTGTEPFSGEPTAVIAAIAADPVPRPRTKRPDIPEGLEAVVMRALEKSPRDRFPDVRALAAALAPFAPENELFAITAAQRLPASNSFAPEPSTKPNVLDDPRNQPTVAAPIERPHRPQWIVPAGLLAAFAIVGASWLALHAHPERRIAKTQTEAADPRPVDLSPVTRPADIIETLTEPPPAAPPESAAAGIATTAAVRSTSTQNRPAPAKPTTASPQSTANPLTL